MFGFTLQHVKQNSLRSRIKTIVNLQIQPEKKLEAPRVTLICFCRYSITTVNVLVLA